jgi:hypothetical protein
MNTLNFYIFFKGISMISFSLKPLILEINLEFSTFFLE